MHNTDFKNWNVFSQNKWNNRLVPLDLQLGYTGKKLGANGFYGPKYPDQYEALHTFFASLKSEITAGRFIVSPSVYWRRNYDRYILNRNDPDMYQNFHRTGVYGANVTASLAGRFGKTNAGVMVRGERIYSNNLGVQTDSPRKIPGQDGKLYTKTDRRTGVSVFAEQNLYIGKWSASVGVLANYSDLTGKLNLYPGIDAAFRPNESIKIYASANRAMRLPTFTDLYYQGPVNIGNPDLKPERSAEYEAGVKFAAAGWNARIGYFYRSIDSAIDWIWLNDLQKWRTMNFADLRMHGISAGGQWDARSTGKNFPIRSFSAYYNFMNGNKSTGDYKSYYAMDYLRHKLTVGLAHRIVEKVNAHWQIVRQDRNGGYMRYNPVDQSETESAYGGFWQIDLRVYRRAGRLNIFAEASNIGGKKRQDIGNVTLPGRWMRAGMELTI
jgi:iron complex outermembrane receptor protein